jgi:hypothetical protein
MIHPPLTKEDIITAIAFSEHHIQMLAVQADLKSLLYS